MTTADLIARLRAGTITPEICEAAAVALEQARHDALEEAAKTVSDRADYIEDCIIWGGGKTYLTSLKGGKTELRYVAVSIRALKGTTK